MARLTLAGLALLSAACAATPPPETANGARRGQATAAAEAAAVRRFAVDEERALRQLAVADPRVAARFGIEPTEDELQKVTVAALVADDATLAVDGRSLDLFAFDARARVLAAAGETVARATEPLAETMPDVAAGPRISTPRLERDLLRRLVIAERARVERERAAGVGAVPLLRGLAAAWVRPRSEDEAKARGRALARRLTEVEASLASAQLTLVDRDALDDALDPLERVADGAGLGEATAAIASLRIELGNVRTVPSRAATEAELARLLAVTGAASVANVIAAKSVGDALTSTEAALRALVKARLDALTPAARGEILGQAGQLLRDPSICPAAVRGSRVRAALPPPERAAVREIVCILQASRTDAEQTAALVVAHDHAAVALWAFDIHARGVEPYKAEDAHGLVASLTAEYATRHLRAAATDPAAAISGGMAVALLLHGGPAHLGARAAAWLAFGDAPLDVVAERALATSPPSRASLRP